ncbi:hypothetical protein XA68_16004 [Ophiocordyceps unilateralis]|uniref:Uncharacterized protein n=1 Tax=Ophiocordyceps unilateralis TaxID=268505 RepID=A0A2A9PM35_OPHUN|nr:hypothetical protein XA68_16004 [Ophiocordyceps unilateralis]
MRYVQNISDGFERAKFYFELCSLEDRDIVVTKFGDQVFHGYAVEAFITSSMNSSAPARAADKDVASGDFTMLCVGVKTNIVVTFKHQAVVESKQAPEALVEHRGRIVATCSGFGRCQHVECQGDECKPEASSALPISSSPGEAEFADEAQAGQEETIGSATDGMKPEEREDACVAEGWKTF